MQIKPQQSVPLPLQFIEFLGFIEFILDLDNSANSINLINLRREDERGRGGQLPKARIEDIIGV